MISRETSPLCCKALEGVYFYLEKFHIYEFFVNSLKDNAGLSSESL